MSTDAINGADEFLRELSDSRCVHIFNAGGRHFVFDGESLHIAEVRESVAGALACLLASSPAQACDRFADRTVEHERASIIAAFRELRAKGMFQPLDGHALEQAWSQFSAQEAELSGLTLLLTSTCNLHCTYCYADQGKFGTSRRPAYMSAAVAHAAARMLVRSAYPVLSVYFLGGEPLLHPGFPTIVEDLQAQATAREKRLRLSVSTNGVVARPEVIDCLSRANVHVAVTIDGDEATHNVQRPRVGGEPSYRAIVDNARKYVSALGPDGLTIVVMCTPSNVDRATEYWADLRAKFGPTVTLSFQPVFVPPGHVHSWPVASARTYRNQIANIFELEKSISRTLTDKHASAILRYNRVHKRRPMLAVCNFAKNQLAVATDGSLYPCVNLAGDERFCMGHVLSTDPVRRPPLVEQWSAGNSVTLRTECADCWAKYTCSGGCLTGNQTVSGRPDATTTSTCEIYKAIAEMGLRRLVSTYERLDVKLPAHATMCS